MNTPIQIGADDGEWLRQASLLAQSCASGGAATATMNGGQAVIGPRRVVIGNSGVAIDSGATGVSASVSTTVRATPGLVGRRLIVPESKCRRTLAALAQAEAGDLSITALSINNGVTNVMSSADEIPAEVFSSLSPSPGVMPFPYAPQNSTINATFKNYGTAVVPDVLFAVEGAIL
jgi:hypothetical protein